MMIINIIITMMVIVATRIPIRNDNRNVNLRDKVVLIVIL